MESNIRLPETSSLEENHILLYEEQTEFNTWLDNRYEGIKIDEENLYFHMSISEILYKLEYEGYVAAKGLFISEKQEEKQQYMENLKQTVINRYPTPVALHFFRTDQRFDTNYQRLYALRDTWESLIFLIFAIVLGECRHIRMPLSNVIKPSNNKNLVMDDLRSDKLSVKIDVIKAIFQYADTNTIDLQCRKIISDISIEKIQELNRVRNTLAHGETISDKLAKDYYEENIESVLNILDELSGLQHVNILRYKRQESNILEVRCEKFNGQLAFLVSSTGDTRHHY